MVSGLAECNRTGTHRRAGAQVLEGYERERIAYQPEELGIAAPLWTRHAVGELIRQQCGIALAVHMMRLYLQRWGFTLKRPHRHVRDQDPEEIRQWLEEAFRP